MTATIRQYVSIEPDTWGLVLAGLFLAVIAGAVALGGWLTGLGAEPAMGGASTGEQAAAGGGWALAEVAGAVLILGVLAVWKRLPEWLQETIKTSALVFVSMLAGAYAVNDGEAVFWTVMVLAIGYYGLIKAADAYDVYWIINNLEAMALAIAGAALVGVFLPLPFLVVGIVLLTVYDHVFANQHDWMLTMASGLLAAKLPLVVVLPPRWRVDWDTLCETAVEEDTDGDEEVFGIGTADLLLPAALAVAVYTAVGTPFGGVLPLLGITMGIVVAAFRLRWEMVNVGSGAGMPAITSGALGGWAVAAVVVMAL